MNRYVVLGRDNWEYIWNLVYDTRFYIIALIVARIKRKEYDEIEIRKDGNLGWGRIRKVVERMDRVMRKRIE